MIFDDGIGVLRTLWGESLDHKGDGEGFSDHTSWMVRFLQFVVDSRLFFLFPSRTPPNYH